MSGKLDQCGGGAAVEAPSLHMCVMGRIREFLFALIKGPKFCLDSISGDLAMISIFHSELDKGIGQGYRGRDAW